MAFLAGLISFSLLFFLAGVGEGWQGAARFAAAAMFILIGVMHLAKPRKLTYMIEGMLPYPLALVLITGVMEVVLGIGLCFAATAYGSAWALMILLVLMFPANIRVAVANLPAPGGLPAKPWYTWSRLLFQPLYIWWLWWAVLA